MALNIVNDIFYFQQMPFILNNLAFYYLKFYLMKI